MNNDLFTISYMLVWGCGFPTVLYLVYSSYKVITEARTEAKERQRKKRRLALKKKTLIKKGLLRG